MIDTSYIGDLSCTLLDLVSIPFSFSFSIFKEGAIRKICQAEIYRWSNDGFDMYTHSR